MNACGRLERRALSAKNNKRRRRRSSSDSDVGNDNGPGRQAGVEIAERKETKCKGCRTQKGEAEAEGGRESQRIRTKFCTSLSPMLLLLLSPLLRLYLFILINTTHMHSNLCGCAYFFVSFFNARVIQKKRNFFYPNICYIIFFLQKRKTIRNCNCT